MSDIKVDLSMIPDLEYPCPECRGVGWIGGPSAPCRPCRGIGYYPTAAGRKVLALVEHYRGSLFAGPAD